jgi:hypothetical protein
MSGAARSNAPAVQAIPQPRLQLAGAPPAAQQRSADAYSSSGKMPRRNA